MHKSQSHLYNWSANITEVKEIQNAHVDNSQRRTDVSCLSRFLASVNIFVEPTEKENVVVSLSKLANLEEIYEVAGEYDIVSLVSASCLEEFRDVMHKKILKIRGIKSTIITIILEPHKGPKCPQKNVVVSTLE
jgi:DNA-binding Lrp family transcriptional regulator